MALLRLPPVFRRLILGVALAAPAGPAAVRAAPAPAETAAARVERLLAAMAGRAAWAAVAYVHVAATHHELAQPAPYANRIWNDFRAPRARFSAALGDTPRLHAIDGARGWRQRDGTVSELGAEQLAGQLRWWESNFYRTLHRLAVADPTLEARAVEPRRLEIFRADGTRLNWFLLNDRGEPVRFGTWDSEAATIFGPLADGTGGLRYPRWGASPDGAFRYEITGFAAAAAVPPDVSFARP